MEEHTNNSSNNVISLKRILETSTGNYKIEIMKQTNT